MFLNVDDGRSQIYSSSPSQGGPLLTFLSVNGGCFRIYNSSTSQGASMFLIVDFGCSLISEPPPRGHIADVLQLNGSRS
jgi:hypothetical protein